MTGAELSRALSACRIDLANEKAAQTDVAAVLPTIVPAGVTIEREYALSSSDRPDFLIDGRIVIEIKVRGAPRALILMQLKRYAEHKIVDELILLSNVAMQLPAAINGKPVHFASAGAAWL